MGNAASTPKMSAPRKAAAPLRVQCKRPAPKSRHDPWEDEAEELAAWLARSRATPGVVPSIAPPIHRVPPARDGWGTPLDGTLADRALRDPGRPLEPRLRAEFEHQLGRDLGGVRIHDGGESRELAHSLGADAFTLGQDIFTTSLDRGLLAHEVVHTVQQEENHTTGDSPPRVQASFERTTADLDPKVEILLDLHLRKKGKKLKAIAEDKLLAADSWWRKFRANVEQKETTAPIDFKAAVTGALKEVSDYKSLDTGIGDPIQNGVAALLADYLRINDAPELAAMVVVEFPWSLTAVPNFEVVNGLATEKKRGKAAMIPLPRIWKNEKPEGAVIADSWTKEITDIVDKFLSLPPLESHRKAREALRDRLKEPLRNASNIPDAAKALPPFERLTDKSTATTNELDFYARSALTRIRMYWSMLLDDRLGRQATDTTTTPIVMWDGDVDLMKSAYDKIGTAADTPLIASEVMWLNPVSEEAHALLAVDVGPVVKKHHDFWANAADTLLQPTPGEADETLREKLGVTTYAQLFFAADAGALAIALEPIARPLADAVEAYFDLFGTGQLPDLANRDTVPEVFAHHHERAEVFNESLRTQIEAPLTEKLYLARLAGKADLARGLAWFALKIGRIRRRLTELKPLTDKSEPVVGIDSYETRNWIASELWELARDALGKTEANIWNKQLPAKEQKNVAGKADVPAAGEWQAIMDRAEKAFTLEDIKTSLLVLLNPFEASETSDTNQLIEDSSGPDVITGLAPFTGRELVKFYDVFYHRELAKELTAVADEALTQETDAQKTDATVKARTKDDLWLVQKAYDALKAREGSDALPKRYESRGVFWARYPGENRAFGLLLERQAAYEFVKQKETMFNVVIRADDGPDAKGDAWAWTLPVPNELVAPLYQIALLRGLGAMAEADLDGVLKGAVTSDAKNAAEVNSKAVGRLADTARELGKKIPEKVAPKEGYYNWYTHLRVRVRRVQAALGRDLLDTQATAAVRAEKFKSLEAEQGTARGESDTAKRRATTMDRQVVLRMNRELLDSAIDNFTLKFPAVGMALDNHRSFMGAVRPERDKYETAAQSAALVLEDADRWIKVANLSKNKGAYQSEVHVLLSRALESFPRLLDQPSVPGDPSAPVAAHHAQGIAWETDEQRTLIAAEIARVDPEITTVLKEMKASLRDRFQWDLGISVRKTQGDTAHADLISHLAPAFPVKSFASIQDANALEKDKEKHVPELIPVGGPLGMKIIKVHEDFTFLPGIGDRATASSEEEGKHALYIPALLYVGIAANDKSELVGLTPTAEENPALDLEARKAKKDQGTPLVDVEIWEGKTLFSQFTISSGEMEGSRSGLNWLTGVVHSTSAGEKFASLAAIVEGFGKLLITAASLYPPTALAVTAAEITAFLINVLGNPEFKEALESIWNDPIESLKHAAGELKDQFTIGRLFDLLLNGNFEPDRFIGSATLRGKKRSNTLTRGRMAKLLTRLKRIGAVLAVRLEAFQENVQGPVHRTEYLMGKHPRLATMLEWLGGHLNDLSDPEGMVLKHPIAGPIYEAYMLYRARGRDDNDGASVIGQPLTEVAEHVQTGIDRMANFELPATIVPLDLAIEALVDIALKLAPKTGKLGIARELALMLQGGLKATGTNTVVYGFLAEQITDSWVDPNHYWKTEVVPLLEPPVKSVIQDAAGTIGDYLTKAPLIGDYFGHDHVKGAQVGIPSGQVASVPNAKAAQNTKIGVSDQLDDAFDSQAVTDLVPGESGMTEAPELKYSHVAGMPDAFFQGIQKNPDAAQGTPGAADAKGDADKPSGSPSPAPAGAAMPGPPTPTGHSSSAFARSSGAPLAPAQRQEAEHKFGHSFSHVRLHQGPEAWGATAHRGADGLTSGNHVFLRPDLSPRSGRGQSVMNHELAHVLQKTSGPSPASKPASGGIRWRPNEENAANRMADRARHNATGRPIPIEGAHRDGASPAIGLDLMETFFKKLSSPSAGSSLAETIEHAHKRHAVADIHPDTLAAANGLWSSVRASMFGVLDVASHFKLSKQTIKDHLENRLSTLTRDGESVPAAGKTIAHLAAMSEKDADPPPGDKKPAAGGAAPAKEKPTFDAAAFLADLSLYITGRTGIVFDFDLSAAEFKRLKSDPHAKVTVGTKVSHVELLFVSNLSAPGLKLWDTTIMNTAWKRTDEPKDRRDALRKVLETEFHAAAPTSTHSDGGAPAAGTSPLGGGETVAKGGPRGSYTPIWDTSKTDLTLNSTYVEKVETQLQPAQLSSDLMPAWGYFAAPAVEPFKTISSATTQVQKNAVHWKGKTHEELTGGTYFLEGNQRNSHHIIQYLLPEYFANIKDFQPFPKLGPGRGYPAVKAVGTRVDTIAGSGQTIGVGQTEAGSRRGHAMPAILLSAQTHQNAGLHVTPKPDDTGKASQGYNIHREFRKFLGAAVASNLGVVREGDALDDYLVGLGASNAKGEAAVVQAVRETYAWIKTQNEQNLVAPEGMPGQEADFYVAQFRGSAEGKKNFKTITGQDYETGFIDIRSRIQGRLQTEAQSALTAAIKTLSEAPLGWKLPGA